MEPAAPADRPPGPALLPLIWLASPALPVGGFSYSEGLEAAVEWAGVSDADSAAAWLLDQLHLSLARSDMPAMALAMVAWREGDLAQVARLNQWLLTTRETAEMRQQTEQMGRSMVDWMRNLNLATAQLEWLATQDPSYPVAFALAAAQSSATPREAALAFGFGWAENMVQAAVKAVPLGQNAGQRILQRLANALPDAADHALGLTEDGLQAFCPMLAILGARHEIQYSRLFRS